MSGIDETDFPVDGLLPKKDTGALMFMTKYPDYDGRGVTIAICDSGVDPGAPGFQTTSDGRPKVIGLYDTTGAGDCRTNTVVKAVDGVITGLSGRKLQVPADWNVPSGEFRLGLKAAYEVFPRLAKDRVKRKKKETEWDPSQGESLAQAMKALDEFDAAHPELSDKPCLKLERAELAARVDVLKSQEKKYHDAGPVYDCVVYHDGTTWRACLDTTLKGDLASCPSLASFNEELQFATFGVVDRANYSVNIYENGSLVDIVVAPSSHGTHVGGIAASYIPSEPERSGVAPGAQLVGIKIGDTRMSSGGQESSIGIIRAVQKCIELKVDVINLSYGEPVQWCNDGRMCEVLSEAVKHGIVFLGSAGNDGPALSTVTAPAGPSEALISVGAYVTPSMMETEYSLRKKLPPTNYTWTSRGPTYDGSLGVDISAPGGAITCVPNWTLRGSQLMNGTSMASPNACGGVALLISGLKSRGIPYNPYSVRRAIENSASPIIGADELTVGHGSLDVDDAFDYMAKYNTSRGDSVGTRVTVSSPSRPGETLRGVYLRQAVEVKGPSEHLVSVTPLFFDNGRPEVTKEDTDEQIAFSLRLTLGCSAPWVEVPRFLELMNGGRSFGIRVDPSMVPPGFHFTQVLGYDLQDLDRGPLVRIPVTVVKPDKVTEDSGWKCQRDNVIMKPRGVDRQFLTVPEGATTATITVTLIRGANTKLQVHCTQLAPYSGFENSHFVNLGETYSCKSWSESMCVKSGLTLEVCVAHFWSSLDEVTLNYSVLFEGIQPSSTNISMHASEGLMCLPVRSILKDAMLTPSIVLKTYVLPLRPSDSQITPLTEARDILPRGKRLYSLLLTYSYSQPKSGDVTFDLSQFKDLLYESPLDSQIWMLFDSNKQFLTRGEAFPGRYKTKLDKGDYTVQLELRHEKLSQLEKLRDVPLLSLSTLSSNVTLDVYSHPREGALRGNRWTGKTIPKGMWTNVYVGPAPEDKVPKGAANGSYLVGTMNLMKDKKDAFPFKYMLFDGTKKKKSPGKSKEEKPKFKESLRDFNISWIPKLPHAEALEVFDSLVEDNRDHVPLYLAKMALLKKALAKVCGPKEKDEAKTRDDGNGNNEGSLAPYLEPSAEGNREEVAKMVAEIESVDMEIRGRLIESRSVLAYFGMKPEGRDTRDGLKSEMDKSRDQVVESLLTCAGAQIELLKLSPDDQSAQTSVKDTVQLLQQFVELTESKCNELARNYFSSLGWYGLAFKAASQETRTKDIDQFLIKMADKLEWGHISRNLEDGMGVRYPKEFAPF